MSAQLVAVFGSSQTTRADPDWQAGYRCGELLAQAGYGVATGGYGGLMEATSAGAAAAGGRVVGVTAPSVFRNREAPNEHVAEERPAADLVSRISVLLGSTAASIALPGSIGTLTELVMAWNVAFVARFSGIEPRPVVAVGSEWAQIIAALGDALETDISLVHCAPDVDVAVAHVVDRLGE